MELTELNLSQEQMDGVQAILQSEGDKIRTKYNKEIKELQEKVPTDKTEAELALEIREKAIQDKEDELAKQEKLSGLSKELEGQGINGELAKYLNVGEETQLEDIFKLIIGDNTYKPSDHTNTNGGVTKEQFNNMSYAERVSLYNANIELYNALSK